MCKLTRTPFGFTLVGMLIAGAFGCSNGGDGGDRDQPNRMSSKDEPVYAMVTLVWADQGPIGYVALSNELDLQDPSLDDAREFTGYASIAVADEHLLVNPSWEDLTIERYRISDDLEWIDKGALSFANEGVEAVSFQTQHMQRDAAYLDVDVNGRVIWNPAEFAISEARTDDVLPLEHDGLELYANLNRTVFVFGDEIVRPFSYHDEDWLRWSAHSPIVVYDAESHEPSHVVEAPCPGLDSITRDEEGNTYLGTFEYSALYPRIKVGSAPCTVKLRPDNTLDETWDPDLTSWTDGRDVVNFRYIGDGKAIAAVLHAEEYGEDFDFPGLLENVDDFWAATARFHRLWFFDLEEKTAAPVQGIEDLEFVNPGFFHAVLEGRTFVFLGDGDNGSNNFNETHVYEIDERGRATPSFKMTGSVTQWIRVR